eukprot:XP_025014299.1 uncharacterized protein LOC112535794 [Ricinus communis]
MLAERQLGTLLCTIESNPMEHCKAITLQSGRQLSGSLPVANNDDVVVQDEPTRKEPELEEIELMRAKGKKKSPVREYQPPIMYHARLRQENMPKYAKFFKEILSNKRRLEDLGLVTLNEECSAILQNKLPVKRRDLGSFTVPYVIGELPISGALADLGASNNLMPTSLFDRLSLSEPKPTRMSIQLADRTIKILMGIVEDILVKGESVVPLILGRPFLAISRIVIDVCNGKLQLMVHDETITFDLATSMRHSLDHDDTVFSMDVLDYVVESHMQEILLNDPLQVASRGNEKELSNEQVLEQLACLLASEPSRSTDPFVSLDRSDVQKVKPSIEDPPVLELKDLPKHLSYAHLDEAKRLLVIIAADLTTEEREMILSSLRKYPTAFAYKITDILGINPSFCAHKILLEDSFRLVVVPRKGGMTMIKNEKDELIPTRTISIAPED